MGRLARKKKRRQQQKKKRIELLRHHGGPYQRIGAVGTLTACLINEDWRERGQAVAYVLRNAPGEGLVMVTFLVDLWCAGLKDAFGERGISREVFDEMVEHMSAHLDFVPVELDVVRGVVAGGIRFAKQNGFRLPAHYDRWVAVMGGVDDWSSADLSDFGFEGKLHWVGPIYDLRRRLIGCSIDEFFAREDVVFTTEVGEDFLSEQDGEYIVEEVSPDEPMPEELLEELRDMKQRLLNSMRRWCFADGEVPHPRLEEALELILASTPPLDMDDEDPTPEYVAECRTQVAEFMSDLPPDDARELDAAMDQYHRFSSSFASAKEFIQAISPDDR